MSPAASVEWSAALIAAMPGPEGLRSLGALELGDDRVQLLDGRVAQARVREPVLLLGDHPAEVGDALERERRRGDDRPDHGLSRPAGKGRSVDGPRREASRCVRSWSVAESQPFGERSERHRLECEPGRRRALAVGLRVADVERPPGLHAEPLQGDGEHDGIGLRRAGLGRADDRGEVGADARTLELCRRAMRPSWTRRRAPDQPPAAAPAPRRRRGSGGSGCCLRTPGRRTRARGRPRRARGRRRCSGAGGPPGSASSDPSSVRGR